MRRRRRSRSTPTTTTRPASSSPSGPSSSAPALLGRVLRNRAALNRTLREKARAAGARARTAHRRRGRRGAHADRRRAARRRRARAERDGRAGGRARAAWPSATRPRAADAFLAVETSGREALDRDPPPARRPAPRGRGGRARPAAVAAPHRARCCARIEAAGLPVELAVEGEERDLPLGLDLTAYRVRPGGARQRARGRPRRARRACACATRDAHVELEVVDDGGEPVAAAARDPRARGALRRRCSAPAPAATAATSCARGCRSEARREALVPARCSAPTATSSTAGSRSSSSSSARSSCSIQWDGGGSLPLQMLATGFGYAMLAWRRTQPVLAGAAMFATWIFANTLPRRAPAASSSRSSPC